MKSINRILVAILCSFSILSCGEDGILNEVSSLECIADLAVTSLDAPSKVRNGEVIPIICTIKNLADSYHSCTESGQANVRVTCAYSPTFQDNFSDYAVFDDIRVPLDDSYKSGEGQTDEMSMPTNQGPGYYAMRVEVDADNEIDAPSSNRSKKNNVKAIVINAE